MSFGVMDIEVPCEILDSKSRMLGSRDTRDGTPSSVVEEYLLGGESPRTRQVVGRVSSTRSSSHTKGSDGIREEGGKSVL